MGDGEPSQVGLSTPTGKGRSGGREPGSGPEIPKQPDDGCPLREISSVMMTSSGFLSPCREGKLPDSRTPHVQQDPEEKKVVRKVLDDMTLRKPVDATSSRQKKLEPEPIQIKQELDVDPPIQIKQEIIDEDDDYEEMIEIQKVHPAKVEKKKEDPKKPVKVEPQKDLKPKYTTTENIDLIMEAVIERGLIESEKYPEPEYSDGDWDMDPGESGSKQQPKKEDKRKRKPNVKKGGPGSPGTMSDMFSAPQHFTANTKTPPKKMARIPKITEKVTLPSASSLMGGLPIGGFPGMGLTPGMTPGVPGVPGMNPLFPMNLYGFGGIPANLIPGFNPNLLNTMAFMQQAAANAAAAAARDSDTVTLDDELEEGEISPPDTPTPPKNVQLQPKREKSPDVEILVEKKDLKKEEAKKREEERVKKEKEAEKEKEREKERKKEKERIEREREKQREEERQKLLIL